MFEEGSTYYIRVRGRVQGPFDLEQLKKLRQRGQFSRAHEVSPDQASWQSASILDAVFAAPKRAAPAKVERVVEEFTEVVEAVPNTPTPSSTTKPKWHYTVGEEQYGPVTLLELRKLVASGEVMDTDLVWREGMPDWTAASDVSEIKNSNNSGSTRPCPACGEMIKTAASKCRFCGEVFDPALKKRKSSGGGGRSDSSHNPAGPGKRLIGVLADGFAALMLMAPGIGLFVAGTGGENPGLITMGFGLFALGALALWGLNLYLLITRSQSIGKYLVNTQIYDYETGERANFVKCWLLRSFVNGLMCSIPFVGYIYSLADVLFVFSENNRCLHDRLAGTYVVDIS